MLRQLSYGEDFPFRAFCSVENLDFIGDHLPAQDTYSLFDYVEYLPYNDSMQPITEGGSTEPEPNGTILRWDFNDAGVVPAGWRLSGDGTNSIADGYLNLTNSTTSSRSGFSYDAEKVGAGKYTWRISVPAIGQGEKIMMGGSLYAATVDETEEYSFSIFVFYGTADNRASCSPAPTSSQLLLRCYTEAATVFKAIDANKEYTLTLDVRVKNDKYSVSWLLDGETIKTVNSFYDPNIIQFELSASTMANGGAWQGSVPCTRSYTAKYDYIEYKKYEY
jgi:hypothetical protein